MCYSIKMFVQLSFLYQFLYQGTISWKLLLILSMQGPDQNTQLQKTRFSCRQRSQPDHQRPKQSSLHPDPSIRISTLWPKASGGWSNASRQWSNVGKRSPKLSGSETKLRGSSATLSGFWLLGCDPKLSGLKKFWQLAFGKIWGFCRLDQ